MPLSGVSIRSGSRRQRAARGCLCFALPPILPGTDGTLARYLCAADSSCYESPPTACIHGLLVSYRPLAHFLQPKFLCSAITLL